MSHLDEQLALLCAIRAKHRVPGDMTLWEIADCCGVSAQSIHKIERKALRKLRPRLARLGIELADGLMSNKSNGMEL